MNRALVFLCCLLAAACGPLNLEEPLAQGESNLGCGELGPGGQLTPAQTLGSCNGKTVLAMQADGNLVSYFAAAGIPLWATSTFQRDATMVMQGDGNLVIYKDGRAVWATATENNPGSKLAVQDDGNIVIYAPNGRPIWATMAMPAHAPCGLDPGTLLQPGEWVRSCNQQMGLVMQGDGNLVLYTQDGRPLWATGTRAEDGSPKKGAFTAMQADGNLVVYNASGQPLWASNTDGKHLSALSVNDDGSLSIIARDGQTIWSSVARGSRALPAKVVGGYWQNWGIPNVALRDVPASYNVVFLAFAVGVNKSSGEVQWGQYVQSDASFRDDVRLLQSQGRKVILSIGGWFDLPNQSWGFSLGPDNADARVDQFVGSIKRLRQSYGFDGIDWDLEHGMHVPSLVAASRRLKAELGRDFLITAAPAPSNDGYTSVALQLGDDFDFIAPMYYDQGCSESASRAQMINRTQQLISAGIPAYKVGLGTRSVANSGSLGDTTNVTLISTINSAWSELEGRFPALRGAYTWSINLDQTVGYAFANQVGPNVR